WSAFTRGLARASADQPGVPAGDGVGVAAQPADVAGDRGVCEAPTNPITDARNPIAPRASPLGASNPVRVVHSPTRPTISPTAAQALTRTHRRGGGRLSSPGQIPPGQVSVSVCRTGRRCVGSPAPGCPPQPPGRPGG